jgi:hypothetical protein
MGVKRWLRTLFGPKKHSQGDGSRKDECPFSRFNRPLVYIFEHIELPRAVFENHLELINELEGKPSPVYGKKPPVPLLHFRSKACITYKQAGGLDDLDSKEAIATFNAVRITPYKRNSYTVYVITFPAPESPPEAYFAAIVHKDSESHEHMQYSPSTRYFILEKAEGTNPPFFCEWHQDGSRDNYGESIPPNIESFVDAVFEINNPIL